MDPSYLDAIVRRADEKVSRRGVLLSVAGGAAMYALRGRGHRSPGLAAAASASAAHLCPQDPVTQSSLAKAKAALAAGKTRVRLSPKGCFTYAVTTKGKVTTDTIAASGTAVAVTTRQGSRLAQKLDADLDGFFELDRIVQRGSKGTLTSTQTQYAPKSRKAIARDTMSQAGSVTTVTLSESVSSSLEPVAMFTVDGPDIHGYAGPEYSGPAGSDDPCSAAQLADLGRTFDAAIRVGLECMQHYDATEILLDVMFSYVARDLVFGCIAKCPNGNQCVGSTPPGSVNDPGQPVEILLPPVFFTLSDYDQQAILWHEFLHSALGYHHSKADLASSRKFEKDRVYACETLCFGRNYDTKDVTPTKCSCAVCLKTTSCDKRCRLYENCDPVFGFICPCPVGPTALHEYPDCPTCLAKCPQGLSCFGYSTCIPRSVSCKAVSCP
jgi:hypothetical protein